MNGPATVKIESALVGAVLYWPEFRRHLAELRDADFSDPTAQRAWKALQDMHATGRNISVVTLYGAIGVSFDDRDDDQFAVAIDEIKTHQKPSDVLDYVDTVRNEAGLRRLGDLMPIIEHGIWTPGARIEDVSRDVATELSDIDAASLPGQETFITHEENQLALIEALKDGEVFDFVKTGFAEFDHVTGGLIRGDLNVLGGSPSMGKTAVATMIATNAARANRGALIISLEMSSRQLGVRISSETISGTSEATPYRKLMRSDPPLSNERYEAVTRTLVADMRIPLSFDTRTNATVMDVRLAIDKARRWMASKGVTLDLVVVDYLNLMRGSSQRIGNKREELGEILVGLKAMAKKEDVAMLLLAQLNRGVNTGNKVERPAMSHLRETGEIEMHADQVLFVYREAYALERRSDLNSEEQAELAMVRNQLELIIAKQRMGATGYIELEADLAHNVVRDRPDLKQEAA